MSEHDLNPFQAAKALKEVSDLPVPQADYYGKPTDFDLKFIANAKAQAARERWENACPVEMRESDWEHQRMKPNAALIAAVLAHVPSKKGLICSGATGRGKTRAMWQLMRRLACDEGKDVRCWQAIDWFTALQLQVSYGRDMAQGWVQATARRPIVFIDDLGQEAMQSARSEWAMSWFFRFLDIRVGDGLPLYVTTNLTADQMIAPGSARGASAIRGDPLVRRLMDLCEAVKFGF